MVTGASTADLAIVLVDARNGLVMQSRRHIAIAGLLGLEHLVVAVNKMDLVEYEQQKFQQIEAAAREFLRPFQIELQFIPLSALNGDNVVQRSENMPWYDGPPLLEYLECVQINKNAGEAPFRFAVQRVVRPTPDFRGYAGTVASGSVRSGDTVTIYPSGRTAVVKSLHVFGGEITAASAGDAVTVDLDSDLDISRGDLLSRNDSPPRIGNEIEANLVWLGQSPAEIGRRYFIKHMTRQTSATIQSINHRLDIGSLRHESATLLETNEIGSVTLRTSKPLAGDNYVDNRSTGSFIVINSVTYATVAAGMITAIRDRCDIALPVSLEERIARQGHGGAVIELGGRVALTGMLERRLFDRGCNVLVSDNLPIEILHFLTGTGAFILLTGSRTEGVSVSAQGSTIEHIQQTSEDSDEKMIERIERSLIQASILK
jgi:sulfate adenylyltransferase large subunit